MGNPTKDIHKRRHCRYIFKKNDGFMALIDDNRGTRPLDISISGIAFQDLEHELIPKVDVNKVISVIIQDEKQHISLNVQAVIRWILFDSFGAEFVNLDKKATNIIKHIIDEIEDEDLKK